MQRMKRVKQAMVLAAVAAGAGACFPIPGIGAPRGVADAGVTTGDAGSSGGTSDGGRTDGAVVTGDGGPVAWDVDGGTRGGPTGGRLWTLAQDGTSGVIFAAGDRAGGLFRSTNEGVSFARVELPAQMARPVVGMAYGSPELVLVADADGRGAWRSRNSGDSWSAVDSLAGLTVTRFMPVPSQPAWLYAAVAPGVVSDADGGTSTTGGLFLSVDLGATFRLVAFAGEEVRDAVYSGSQHVAATAAGLLRASTGGGTTSLGVTPVVAVAADPLVQDAYIVATVTGGVSRVGSTSTTPFTGLSEYVPDGALLVRGTEVLLVAGDGIYRGTSSGPDAGVPMPLTSFTRVVTVGNDTAINAIVPLLGSAPGVLVSTGGDGIQRLAGVPGRALSAQAPANGLTSAQRCPSVAAGTATLLVGCVVDGVLGPEARIFEGASVALLAPVADLGIASGVPTAHGPVAVAVGADGARYVAVGTLYRAEAGGAFGAVNNADVFFASAHPRVAQRVLLGVLRSDLSTQLQVSADRASTLLDVPQTRGLIPWQVAWHPSDDNVAWVVSAPELELGWGLPGGERGLFRTTDGFASLGTVALSLDVGDGPVGVAVVDTAAVDVLVATQGGRVLRARGAEGAFTLVGNVENLVVTALVALPGRPGAAVVAGIPAGASARAVRFTTNHGETWTDVPVDVPAALRLEPEANGSGVFVGTLGQGTWRVALR